MFQWLNDRKKFYGPLYRRNQVKLHVSLGLNLFSHENLRCFSRKSTTKTHEKLHQFYMIFCVNHKKIEINPRESCIFTLFLALIGLLSWVSFHASNRIKMHEFLLSSHEKFLVWKIAGYFASFLQLKFIWHSIWYYWEYWVHLIVWRTVDK